jgi:hypothetical protein
MFGALARWLRNETASKRLGRETTVPQRFTPRLEVLEGRALLSVSPLGVFQPTCVGAVTVSLQSTSTVASPTPFITRSSGEEIPQIAQASYENSYAINLMATGGHVANTGLDLIFSGNAGRGVL